MARSSGTKSAEKASLSGKRKREPKYECETNWTLRKHKERSEEKETTHGFADNLQEVKGRVESLELKSEASLIPVKETVEELDETPHFVEGVAARKKSLIIDNLSFATKISEIINFFEDVAKVVNVRIIVYPNGWNYGCGSVEFASANEAKKAQYKKHGEYLRGQKIFLGFAQMTPYPQRPKFCIEHKVWYEDYIRRESIPIEGVEIPPRFFEAIAAREQTIFVANISPQTKMLHIIEFFKNVAEDFSIRLIVNNEGKHVGYGFVEFAHAFDAKKALEKKNGQYLHDHKIFLDDAKKASFSPRPKYSLAEKLWYEDYLFQESFLKKDQRLEARDETCNFVEAVGIRKKTLVIGNLACQTKISDIINFFKDVAEVVHVRLIVNKTGQHVGNGFVEFASAHEAKKAQEKKNGEYLSSNQITLGVAELAPCPPLPMYCIDHKVWYEDYLRGENLLIEEDEGVERLDELVEEVSVRKKTLFIQNLPPICKIPKIISFIQDVGEVSVRIIVNDRGRHVGCGFVKFASDIEAKKALEKRLQTGGTACNYSFFGSAEIAPYPLRPKYKLAEEHWYEECARQEEKLKIKDISMRSLFCWKKITFSDDNNC
ncbi:unnamed protein product [Cuscuta campestris]|uniref:RRM domain-containing protein n=1 Tax=Cuscuta campestris TaxID=132261 RepID=A0A484NIB1_9ASTE|nr:unnamed protein product [Cuscuta campestris]